jgi:acyl-CoA thioester hydrolase
MSDALFEKVFEIRWADCDANQHMRHSAYSDLCAHTRIGFLAEIGMTPKWFKENGIGPVLFKEETEYFREVFMGEQVRVTVETGEPTGSTKSVSIVNKVYKPSGELAAQHQVIVGWMDVKKRKVVELPEKIRQLYLSETVLGEISESAEEVV